MSASCASDEVPRCEPTTTTWQPPLDAGQPGAPADTPLTVESIALGEALFFDPRLSGSGTTSCASCHDPQRAFTDGRARSLADDGELTSRSAPSLVDVGSAASLTWANPLLFALEDHALIPLFGEAPREMASGERRADLEARISADPALVAQFEAAFPCDDDPVSLARVADALASYQRTLRSGRSRYDEYRRGDLTALDAAEQRGLALVTSDRLGCTHCHIALGRGAAGVFHNTGLYSDAELLVGDRGLYEHTRRPEDLGRFAVPTLRNVALTAPYMHDGSLSSLDDVLSHYVRSGANPDVRAPVQRFELSREEREDILAFFDSLSEPSDAFVAPTRGASRR